MKKKYPRDLIGYGSKNLKIKCLGVEIGKVTNLWMKGKKKKFQTKPKQFELV